MKDIADKIKTLGAAAEAIKKIENETKETNFNWSLLFPEKEKLHLGWLISSIATFVIICGATIIFGVPGQNMYIALFAAGLLCAAWVSCCAHLRFDNTTITGGGFFALVITLLVVGRVLTPSEGANRVLEQISETSVKPQPETPTKPAKTEIKQKENEKK